MWFKASAPGSLMMLGEYAVLHGGDALVCAVDQRMSVKIIPRDDATIFIHSSLGFFETHCADITIAAPFEFILTILKHHQDHLPSGCDIHIESEFSHQIGLGSSAAVTAAMLMALHHWLAHANPTHIVPSATSLIEEARTVIRYVQGQGSGADVAASILGGMIAYRAEPFYAEKLANHYPLTVLYSGSKTKTREAIVYVEKKFAAQPTELQTILKEIQTCARGGIQSVRDNNIDALAHWMQEQQRWMCALGVNTTTLDNIIHTVHQTKKLQGAKISGSGLGDCVIALGHYPVEEYTLVPCAMTSQGVCYEKN